MKYTLDLPRLGWLLFPALLLGAGYVWHVWRSRSPKSLILLRAAASVSAVMALLNPAMVSWGSASHKPRLLILVDSSDSMGQREGKTSRLASALAWLEKNQADIESRADPVLISLSDRSRRLLDWQELKALKSSNAALAPGPAIGQALSDWPAGAAPERAWLLSDGNGDPPGEIVPGVKSLGIPVDAIGVGRVSKGASMDFLEIKTPDFAFVHESFEVRSVIEASDLAGRKLVLRLISRDTGATIAVKEVDIPSDYATVTATFTVANAQVGIQKYRLEAAPLTLPSPQRGEGTMKGFPFPGGRGQGEGVLGARDFEMPVLREKYRVIDLTGRPSPDYVFLRRFIKEDPNRELVSFVILRNPENPAAAPESEMSLIPFPVYQIFVSDISQFDLFILENFSYARFNLPAAYLESVRTFVANGGSLLVVGGDEAFTAGGWKGGVLDDMLPVTLSANSPDFDGGTFSPAVTAKSHPLTQLFETPEESLAAWKALPPLKGFAHFESVKADATVLATVPGQKTADGRPLPFLALRSYGRGRVLLVNSNSTWRWKLRTAADPKLNTFYSRFWSKALSYLVGNLDVPRVKFSPLPERLVMAEPAVFTLKVFDQDFRPAKPEDTEVSVIWTDPKGRAREVPAAPSEPGTYLVSLTGISAGTNRLHAFVKLKGTHWGEASQSFNWNRSQTAMPMAWRRLKQAAEATTGDFSKLGDANAATLLNRLRESPSQEIETRRYYPASTTFWFWLTALLWTCEWALRRWKGYV
jgi:uncharacterized membrane protein